jgi:hypothetical protein
LLHLGIADQFLDAGAMHLHQPSDHRRIVGVLSDDLGQSVVENVDGCHGCWLDYVDPPSIGLLEPSHGVAYHDRIGQVLGLRAQDATSKDCFD